MTATAGILSDLITEGKQAKRIDTIKRAAEKTRDAESKKPLEDGPPIRRDIYQQLEWSCLSITLVTTQLTCKNCGERHSFPNPTLFVERYHRRHGRHLVEIHNFNLLPRDQIEALPRRVEERFEESLYCHNCFLQHQEPLCLDQQQQPIQESSPLTSLPCVPQQLATPSAEKLWSDTLGRTLTNMNEFSKLSESNVS